MDIYEVMFFHQQPQMMELPVDQANTLKVELNQSGRSIPIYAETSEGKYVLGNIIGIKKINASAK